MSKEWYKFYDSLKVVVDEITDDTVVLHFQLDNKLRKESFKLPPVRLKRDKYLLLDGVTIKTKLKDEKK